MKTATMTNGVDTAAMAETKGMLRRDPAMARVRFHASHRWINGPHGRVTILPYEGPGADERQLDAPFVLDHSEPPALLGADEGPNPVEYLLTALAGCVTTGIVYYAAAMGIELRSVESTLEGDLDLQGFLDLDPAVRPGYQAVRIRYRIESDAPREQVAELVQMAKGKSPVFDVVTNGTAVDVVLD